MVSDHVGSMEELEIYLQKYSQAADDLLQLVRHLVEIASREDEIPSRDFLLQAAEFWHSDELNLSAREFIAKRLFAFWRKQAFPLLQENLSHFAHRQISSHLVLHLLQFDGLPQEVQEQLEEEKKQRQNSIFFAGEETDELPPDFFEGKLQVSPAVEENFYSRLLEGDTEEMPSAWEEEELLPDEFFSEPEEEKPQEDLETESEQGFETLIAFQQDLAATEEKEEKEQAPSGFDTILSTPKEKPKVTPFFQPTPQNLSTLEKEKQQELERSLQRLKDTQIKKVKGDVPHRLLLERMAKTHPQHYLRSFQGVLDTLHSTQEKYPLMRIKYFVNQYEAILTSTASLLVFINYGNKKTEAFLEKFAKLSSKKAINSKILEYYCYHLEHKIQEHSKSFRKAVESCHSEQELKELLALYPLYEESFVKQHPCLKIISQIKAVLALPANKREKVLERNFATSEANIKRHLTRLLLENQAHQKLLKHLGPTKNINELLLAIKKLRQDKETKGIADTLFHLIVTFIKGKQKLPFQTLQTSLNTLPPGLQRHILKNVRKKLRSDLEKKITKLLQQGDPVTSWNRLLALLTNPQVEEAGIKLFGYPVTELREKLRQVENTSGEVEKLMQVLFSSQPLPDGLSQLLKKRHAHKHQRASKSLGTCLEELAELQESFAQRRVVSLKGSLIPLLQSHGQVNFSCSAEEIDGYQLARIVTRFYQNPSRKQVELPRDLEPRVGKLISQLMNKERQRQLSKLQQDQHES